VYTGRKEEMDDNKVRYARETKARTLGEVIEGADVFLGLSAGGGLKPEMVKKMAAKPLILALANPEPEILPEKVKEVRDDAVIATGRSDYPNQVNNVLCFPFIFRGALDVGATTINEPMKLAAVNAIADLALAEQSDIVAQAYGSDQLSFGPEYLIPRPFDPRLIVKIAPAVAQAAMDSGVATDPIKDFPAYVQRLNEFVYHSGLIMKPIFAAAKESPRRIVFAEGEDERVLRAAQVVADEGLAKVILVGRPAVIERRIKRFGLRIQAGVNFEVVNPESDQRFKEYWQGFFKLAERRGVSQDLAQMSMRQSTTLIGAMMIHRGEADGMICGISGTHQIHLRYIDIVLGRRPGVNNFYAMNLLMLPKRTVFICDTYVNVDPTPEQIVEMTGLAAEELCRFGLVPKVALLSHSSFGNSDAPPARKMREALELIRTRMPHLDVEGEMHGDAALSAEVRLKAFPNARMKEDANLLIMPTLDAANISFNLLKVVGGAGITVGPILLGAARPVHILTPTATVRRIINMTALAVVDAQEQEKQSMSRSS
ncbi:MAG TPA: phosphate acyltransferase, partial [Usitatibacter sp.]|nr:phosphate acyltransferase [Usitatibacter sp.]